MPIGSYTVVADIAHELHCRKPHNVLDLGVGFGMYGAAVREWVDMGVKPFSTRLVGVEVFDKYSNPVWGLYDEMHIVDIESYLDSNDELFDAIVIADVIEHFEKGKGLTVIAKAKERLNSGGILLISTPAWFNPQGAEYGNVYETHRSLWAVDDFVKLGLSILKDGSNDRHNHRMIVAKYS